MVNTKPVLFVVAGPNGAGKSAFSSKLASTEFEVFDGDKYVTALKGKFPETGSDVLQDWVNDNDFRQAKDQAIRAGKSFAYETNFSSDDPIRSLREFNAAGFLGHLIFIGVNTLEECVQRVSVRVRAGGHKVSEQSIEFNFEFGYKNLYQYYHHFDTVTLLENSIAVDKQAKAPKRLIIWKNGSLEFCEKDHPEWVGKFVKAIKEKKKRKK